MKKYLPIIEAFILWLLVMLTMAYEAGAQVVPLTNTIFGVSGDYSLAGQGLVTATATLLVPNPQFINNVQVRQDPVQVYADTNGMYTFTNFQAGYYSCQVAGSPGSFFNFNIWTNTLGSIPIGSLITNAAALLPDPGTNYYTISQLNAKFPGLVSGGSSSNLLWNTSTNLNGARLASVLWVFPTPPYNATNFPYSLITTN